ncbi:hypothetical protein QJS66_21230 [Kocuria rhizophila]|nr:hypothetical protein QJS66_21230 [Kocuria rhizophila]
MRFVPVESAWPPRWMRMPPPAGSRGARRTWPGVPAASLPPLLKAVAFSWRQATLTVQTDESCTGVPELDHRMGAVGKHLSDMGGSLRSVDGYNKLAGSLESRGPALGAEDCRAHPTATDSEALETRTVESWRRHQSQPRSS